MLIRNRSQYSLIAFFVFTLLLIFLPTVSATAHDQLIEQNPAPNEHFSVSPETIVLEYNNQPLDMGAVVRITDIDGTDWAVGEPVIKNFSVTQAVEPELPDGYYRVQWRVVSSDGHPISESFLFSVGEVTEDTPKPPVGSAASAESPAETGSDDSQQTRLAENLGPDEPQTASGRGPDAPPWQTPIFVITGIAIAVAIYALAFAARKPKN